MKSCFLYFGAFEEDEEILVKKLKWLWIAEGFVRYTNNLEDVAEEYFMDLVNRSLVIASIGSSLGRVKTCRIHDLVHEFCLKKAQEESFLLVVREDDGSKFSSIYDERRLKIYSQVKGNFMKMAGFNIRSLLHTAGLKSYIELDVSFIVQNFKLLRVLDLADARFGDYFNGIELLVHLRYFAIKDDSVQILSSIANLRNLQFFLLKAYRNTYQQVVPDSVWDMLNLRHLHIYNLAPFDVDANVPDNSILDNLETLSTPCFCYKEGAENLFRRLPKLRKLKCIFYEYWDKSSNCCQFPVLDFLDQLLSLNVVFQGTIHYGERCVFNFPSNLQKLTLSNFSGLPWVEISKIGRTLPNLKVIKLIGSDRDNTWIVKDWDFPKLKYLKLSHIRNLCDWTASEDSFPILEQLVLDDLWYLEEIPSCFAEITTLQMITVKDCNSCVDDSARRIQMEQQEEWQNEDLKVYICPRDQEYESESA